MLAFLLVVGVIDDEQYPVTFFQVKLSKNRSASSELFRLHPNRRQLFEPVVRRSRFLFFVLICHNIMEIEDGLRFIIHGYGRGQVTKKRTWFGKKILEVPQIWIEL